MNWIFEVYGDTYTAILTQGRKLPDRSDTVSGGQPLLRAIRRLLGTR